MVHIEHNRHTENVEHPKKKNKIRFEHTNIQQTVLYLRPGYFHLNIHILLKFQTTPVSSRPSYFWKYKRTCLKILRKTGIKFFYNPISYPTKQILETLEDFSSEKGVLSLASASQLHSQASAPKCARVASELWKNINNAPVTSNSSNLWEKHVFYNTIISKWNYATIY